MALSDFLSGLGGKQGGLAAASPLLLAMSQNMLTPPNQRDPRTVQMGLMGMMQQADQRRAQAQQEQMREAIQQALPQMEGLPQGLAPLIGALPPEQGASTLADFMKPQQMPGGLVTLQERARMAGLEPGSEEFRNFMITGGRQPDSINVNMPQVGNIPQGYELRKTPEGAWQMAPIPGGPAAREVEQAERQEAGQQALQDRYGGVVLDDIDRVRKRIEASPLMTTGIGGAVLSQIPGSGAFDVRGMIDTIRSNIGFDRLQQMREASPTGGALGQVSNREIEFLQSTLGNLGQAQSEEQLLYNLTRVEDIYRGIMEKAAAYPNAAEFGFAGGGGAPEATMQLDGRTFRQINGEWYEVPG